MLVNLIQSKANQVASGPEGPGSTQHHPRASRGGVTVPVGCPSLRLENGWEGRADVGGVSNSWGVGSKFHRKIMPRLQRKLWGLLHRRWLILWGGGTLLAAWGGGSSQQPSAATPTLPCCGLGRAASPLLPHLPAPTQGPCPRSPPPQPPNLRPPRCGLDAGARPGMAARALRGFAAAFLLVLCLAPFGLVYGPHHVRWRRAMPREAPPC